MKRVLIVHFSGDFRAAHQRRKRDGSETYFGHGYILDQLEQLGTRHGAAAYLSCLAPRYREENGVVTLMGGGTNPLRHPARILADIAAWRPTHVIVHGPMMRLLAGIRRMDVELGCMWADSFCIPQLWRTLRYGDLAARLNDPRITLVGNHGINAARGLAELGVDPARIVPWDFPHPSGPETVAPRTLPDITPGDLTSADGTVHELLYVGSLDIKKGVSDAIRAMAHLEGIPARLTLVGSGADKRLAALARRLGVAERVYFAGHVDNARVQDMMRKASAVLVPSRHAFPEGLPLTLFEAIAARTPVIASDHPMFRGHARDRETAMVHPAGNPRALAATITALLSDPALYARISQAAPEAWASMQVPARWGQVIDHWVAGGQSDRGWLAAHSLAAWDHVAPYHEPAKEES